LGFFRIWAGSHKDYSSSLGRYVPYAPLTTGDLKKLGFDKGRIRWVSQPHIPTEELMNVVRKAKSGSSAADIKAEADKIFSKALIRVNEEELWLFKKKIAGEKDIDAFKFDTEISNYLKGKWKDRVFLEYRKGKFFPTWYFRNMTAYKTFTAGEKSALEELLGKRQKRSERVWSQQGLKLLSVLVQSSTMLPCAEDLGAVPACVPKVLTKLKILGLRVTRWHREWDKNGQPYIPFENYPQLSVCTPAVHDSSTVREWWEREADQGQFAGFLGVPLCQKFTIPARQKSFFQKPPPQGRVSAFSRYRIYCTFQTTGTRQTRRKSE